MARGSSCETYRGSNQEGAARAARKAQGAPLTLLISSELGPGPHAAARRVDILHET